MILKKACLTIILILNFQTIFSQSRAIAFSFPMHIEPKLSANFGELRRNHFHSGLDLRTESKTGIPVYAAEDGYLVRVFVSPYGFGKALYINHSTSYTTVYGHLERFSDPIEKYIKTKQYEIENFSINDFPNKDLFIIKKGDLIGYSGNSGSSGGPHLHFEIRDQQTEEILNPLGCEFLHIEDNIPPKIKSVLFYQIDSIKNIPIPSIAKVIPENKLNDTILVPKSTFLGVECSDYMPSSNNEYLIKQLKIFVDSNLFYDMDMTRFSFSETSYINSVIDYNEFVTNKREIIRVFKEPNNKFSVLAGFKGTGIIKLQDTKVHHIKISITDNSNNFIEKSFWIKGSLSVKRQVQAKEGNIPLIVNREFSISKPNSKLTFQKESLFQSLLIPYKEDKSALKYSNAITIGMRNQALNKGFELSIKTSLPFNLEEKAFIARGSNKNYSFLGGIYDNGRIATTSNEFGRFFVDVDTIPPIIRFKYNASDKIVIENNKVNVILKDDKTGVKSYDIYIDGKWAIGDYDPKSDLLTVLIDEERIGRDKKHFMEIYAADGVGNTAYLKCEFNF